MVIGAACTIHSDATIEDSVIWGNTQIGHGAVVKSCALANDCHLNADCFVQGSILGDNVVIISGCQLKPDSKIWPETRVETGT